MGDADKGTLRVWLEAWDPGGALPVAKLRILKDRPWAGGTTQVSSR